MLQSMAEVNGWTIEYMLAMKIRLFHRLYGYWYQDRILEHEAMEEKNKDKDNSHDDNKEWKKL